jgi:hypothetical protein
LAVARDLRGGVGGHSGTDVPFHVAAKATSSGEDLLDDSYKMLVVAALAVSATALILSMIAVCLLCQVMGIHRRLNMQKAREMPLSMDAEVEMSDFRRGSKSHHSDEEEFLSFCEEDGADTSQIRRASQMLAGQHGIALAGDVDFGGTWECVETFGLDEFLQAMKVGRIRRMAAVKAPWPSWQFTHKGNDVTYINKSKFGVMTEAFKVDGSEYSHKDLEGNVTTCKARIEGTSLIIERVGKEHKATETRTIKNGDTMDFKLEMAGISQTWGRRFTRKSKK